MAEVTGLRNNALGYPVYGVPWGVVFPMLDADGDLVTGATTPDAERSLNGDTFADCTNESTEIATNSGIYYLLLTAAEMTADVVAVIAKSASAGMKTTAMTLYPRKLVSLRAGTVGANAADGTTLQLDSNASAVDDFYNGCLLVGTLDSNVEARMITDYAGSTKVCTVSPAFVTTPDNNDTFVVYDTEQRQIRGADLVAIGAAAVSTSTAQLGVNAVQAGGTAWGSGAITAASIATGAIDADAIADNAIDAGAIASGAITNAKFAAGAIDATAIANGAIDAATFAAGAIDAAALAADAGTEIATAVWASGTRTLTAIDEDATTLDLDATIRAAVGLAAADLDTQLGDIQTDVDSILADTGTDGVVVASIANNAITAAAIANGAIDAATFAAGAIDAAALAADAGTEIGTAVWATAARTLTAIDEDNTTLDLDATIRAAVGLAAADLDTQLDAIPTAAEINAEVVDALATDTYAEPGQGTPGATAALSTKINYLYKAWRNRHTQTADTYSLYGDDATTVDQTAAVSDNGTTFDRGEVTTGA